MHVTVDLGFRNLVVVVCVLLPVIGFFFARHKWRQAAARSEEIRRLLALAAEEASRAEFEVTAGYDVVSVAPERRDSYCAVCYCPTNTRCARCKAVRYWYVIHSYMNFCCLLILVLLNSVNFSSLGFGIL